MDTITAALARIWSRSPRWRANINGDVCVVCDEPLKRGDFYRMNDAGQCCHERCAFPDRPGA